MQNVTLIHTRYPKDEFIFDPSLGRGHDIIDDVDDLSDDQRGALYRTAGRPLTRPANRIRYSGQWGTMMMVTGGPIHFAQFDRPVPEHALCGGQQIEFTVNYRKIYAAIFGEVTSTKLFTTIERFRTDDGKLNEWGFGYVRMLSRETPYGLRVERNNPVVATLRKGHDGTCIRVLGGATLQQQAILIHEAPNITWVKGCIGPRPHGDRRAFDNTPGNPADVTVREIVAELNANGGKGQLFVLKG